MIRFRAVLRTVISGHAMTLRSLAAILLLIVLGGPSSAQAQVSATPVVAAPPRTEPEIDDLPPDVTETDVEARPSINCIPDTGSTIGCDLDPGHDDVAGGRLSVTAGPGWFLTANSVDLPGTGAINLATLMDGALAGRVSIAADFPAGCPDPSENHFATIAVDYIYPRVPVARAETTVALAVPAQDPVAPDVAIASLDFGTLTRDVANGWSIGHAATIVSIDRDGCGDLGAFDIRIRFTGEIPGFAPDLTGVAADGDTIALVDTAGDPNAAPVTVAHVPTGFIGSARLTLTFGVNPDEDFAPGPHEMGINVTPVEATP